MRVFGGEEEGGGVSSGPGEAETILHFLTISARTSRRHAATEAARYSCNIRKRCSMLTWTSHVNMAF